MKIFFQLLLVAVLAIAGCWLWTFLRPSPQHQIRSRLGDMAREASYDSDPGGLAAYAAAQNLGDFFSTNSQINLDFPGDPDFNLAGRDEIVEFILRSHSVVRRLKVDLPDLNVTVAPDKDSATADLTFRAQVNGSVNSVAEELKLTLQKIDGQWLITHIESVQVLT